MSGMTTVKSKDYQYDSVVEASNLYAAWKLLQTVESPLSPGDLLETVDDFGVSAPGNPLFILKYIGFEPANWFVPEMNTAVSVQISAEAPVSPVPSLDSSKEFPSSSEESSLAAAK